VDLWVGNVPAKASTQLQINQHGGELRTWAARANYGFLDGHAETRSFAEVFTDMTANSFFHSPGLKPSPFRRTA
jgi:prepilin-type processing-associated H-X9-DG protein